MGSHHHHRFIGHPGGPLPVSPCRKRFAADAGWSKMLSTELAPHGVTVNMILLGRSDTDRVRSTCG